MTDEIVSNAATAKPGNYSPSKSQNRHRKTEGKEPLTKVLIVDNCASTRLLLEHYARLRNFKTASAPSGEAALELAAHQAFDLVFMDISMPGMDGMEAIRRMRQLDTAPRRTQYIICSGYTPHDLGPQQGECGFLHKPICRQNFNLLMDEFENRPPLQAGDQFDDTVLISIFDEADDRLKLRICMELCNDINRHVNNMLTAHTQQDLTAFERATHALKGISGTFGAVSLYNLAQRGNQLARNARSDDAFSLATKIEASALLALNNVQRFFVPANQPPSQIAGHNHE